MFKLKIISILLRILMGGILLGAGIWFVSSSISGTALTYTNTDNFLRAIGVTNGDISSANGCFMCSFVADLFSTLGNATELFWTKLLDSMWILLALGFGVFLIIYTIQYLLDAAKQTAKLDGAEKKLEFKGWFDKVWRQGLRVLIVGAIMGVISGGGTDALKVVSKLTITPVMYLGAELSVAASGLSGSAKCPTIDMSDENDILGPVIKPFSCVIGNVNTVMLAGAAGGFAMMNYAWLGLGAGLFTWLSGLALVIMFMVIGFDLFFQLLSVVFKTIFVIIFMPILLAAAAFEGTWKMASGLTSGAINMIVSSAVKIVGIALKTIILYETVYFVADTYYPGPRDGFTALLPPLIQKEQARSDANTQFVINTFVNCERVSVTSGGAVDEDRFLSCFNAAKSRNPSAFRFLENGSEFLLMMLGLFILYLLVVRPKVDKLLAGDGKESFDFGGWVKDVGRVAWNGPLNVVKKVTEAFGKTM